MGKILSGTFLVLLGLSILFQQSPFSLLGLDFGSIFSLFWVVVGILLLTRKNTFWGFLFLLIGSIGFVSGLFHIDLGAWIFPILIIALGLNLLFKKPNIKSNMSGNYTNVNINESVIFGSLEKKYNSKNFNGGKVDCVFSGLKLDLSQIEIDKNGAELEVNAVFGGGEIIVPKNVIIISNGVGIFGGWSNKFDTDIDTKSPVLKISGAAVFGGIEIKN